MPDTIIECALTGKLDAALLMKWLNEESIEDTPEDCILNCCNRNEFVAYFLSYLRNQTDSILQTNSNAIQILHNTPEKILSSRRKHRRSISDPTSDDRNKDSLSVKPDRHSSHESPSKDKKRGRKVKTKLFPDDRNQSVSSDESRLSTGVDRLIISSTPMKNGFKPDYPNLASPVTPTRSYNDRCDTPRLSHRHSRSSEKSCLGDYLVNVKSTKKKKSMKNDSDPKIELDISNSEMFPEIGAKKPSSKEKRRIKPTHVDPQKSALNFSTDCFQQPSPLALEDNAVFKQQKLQPKESASNFETERNILKQERHKLMEKFNILNTHSSPKATLTPQIKITQKDSFEKSQNFAKVDVKRVVMRDKLDFLVEIYDTFFKNNLILSVNTEIYYLISLLLSKQCEEDCVTAENKLIENDFEHLLKSINNSTYFAVKSLWNLRNILEVILDKNSLKTLGENKKVRNFYPDLAKFLLNCYGLRCEAEANQEKPRTPQDTPVSNGVICFNFETDNADNFPSALSFQNFKKQRDMFYEIVRWYGASRSDSAGGTSSGAAGWVRARVKGVVGGAAPANLQHLAALYTSHMLAQCTSYTQESKLSKLQRRLTCPAAPESHRLPHFTDKEMFYKDFILNAENEAFRVHLRDALSSQIIALDSTHLAIENSNTDITKEYVHLTKKLSVLAKFLGYLTALPYSHGSEGSSKSNLHREHKEPTFPVPKEKVLENDIALRNYSQPNLDIKGYLQRAQENGRLSITIPWIVHYLSMLDFTSLRIKYYRELLKMLFDIYINTLKFSNENLKKNTVIYLKSILGWLFDLPQFPQELFYEKQDSLVITSEVNIDSCDLVDESVIFDLCPYLRDVNVLLSTCRVSQAKVCSYRHITPVSLSLNPEDRIKSKEKELQSRLEEELLKSQPSSTRRVLELVIERVTAAAVKELSATVLLEARDSARDQARQIVAARSHEDTAALLVSVRQCYSSALSAAVSRARESSVSVVSARARAALSALLAGAAPALHALAARAAARRLGAWINANWNTTAILCKDIESEVRSLCAGDCAPAPRPAAALAAPHEHFARHSVSPAACIINLKELVCSLLEGGGACPGSLLRACAWSCARNNVFCRAPTQRALLQLSVDLAVVYVSRRPNDVTESFLTTLDALWSACCGERRDSPPHPAEPIERPTSDEQRAPTPDSEPEESSTPTTLIVTNVVNASPAPVVQQDTDKPNPFERILCPRNMVIFTTTPSLACDVWEALARLLLFLLRQRHLSEDSLTEQCLAVYRQDWPQNVLANLSSCMKSVARGWCCSPGKFTLFLDFLAEYCGDLDADLHGIDD